MVKLKAAPSEAYADWIAKEVWEYDIPGLELETPFVLDIGANIGAFACWALERWPGAEVNCYEPVPANFDMLRQNVPECFRANVAVTEGRRRGRRPGVDARWPGTRLVSRASMRCRVAWGAVSRRQPFERIRCLHATCSSLTPRAAS